MTLRQRILLLGLIALAGMAVALWRQYGGYVDQYQAVEAVTASVRAAGGLSHAVHEIQRERGLTVMALAAGKPPELAGQAAATDAALVGLAGACGCGGHIGTRLSELRRIVAADNLAPLAARDRYNELVQTLLDEMAQRARAPGWSIARDEVSAHFHLVAAKEYLGQLRATMAFWLSDRSSDFSALHELVRIDGLFAEELRRFRLDAAMSQWDTFEAHFAGDEVRAAGRILARATAGGSRPADVDAATWWRLATVAIDRMKAAEDASLELIAARAMRQRIELRNQLATGIGITVVAGLAVLVLMVSAIYSLLRALGRALASMERIAVQKDFHSRLPADSPDEIGRISRSFNDLLAIAEKLLDEKDYLAATDPLTGIPNRLRFARVFGEEVERKRRHPGSMALVLFDVDHFKRINDTLGHNAGDEVLKELARKVAAEIRATDVFARWGGEEFVLLLRDDDCAGAMALANKLRAAIAGHDFPRAGCITCSFGVAAWQPEDTETTLVKRADDALYAAKAGGRNRVRCEAGAASYCERRRACG